MTETPFVHLRCHSEYSLVDGLLYIKPMIAKARQMNMPAIALTEEMNLFSAIKFYKAALAEGIKPIFGADCWLWDDQLERRFRFTLLCINNQGFKQLSELLSDCYLDSRRIEGIPVVSKQQLQKQQLNQLICLNGGLDGEAAYQVSHGHLDLAKKSLQRWMALFGENNFFIELQRVHQNAEEAEYNQLMIQLAHELNLPVVATHNVRFLEKNDFKAHEVRVAIYDGYTLADKNRPQRYSENQYLTSMEKMSALYDDCPSAVINTLQIAKRCNVNFTLGEACLPAFPIPEGDTEASYFRRVSHEGLIERLQQSFGAEYTQEQAKPYLERLEVELNVIINMGFPGYFLIVADFIQWAKNNGVPVGPGRGSGAGSLVAYALKITDLDPLPYDLLFERFLNPERVSMPDFDVDFCMDGRDRVIEYVAERYGRFSVSQIITFGSMAAKAVIRDVGRVMGQPYGFVDSIAKLIPMDLGMTLEKAFEQEPKLKERYETEEEVKAIFDMARQLEGTVRNVGKHAGGVVIAPSKLTDFTPIFCEADSRQLVTQYDKDDVEAAGLVKFDFLGLRNLTIINNALKIVNKIRQEQGKPELLIESIPLDDPQTFQLLKACYTTAVFQLESRGMKELIKRLQPDCFEDIVALVALFRPGPLQSGMVDDFINRKHGRAEVEYPHPWTEAILKPTYGIILYQEQVMKLAQVLANYSLGEADLLRRAMGKKKPEEMAKQREIFLKGAKENNITEETANYIFDLMEKFAGYGFNKSHSAAYALVAYQTAYLKAHYPAAFMAAVLSSDMDNTDKVVNFLEDTFAHNLVVKAPDINVSHYAFTVQKEEIVYGLGAIKGVGENAIELIVEERCQNGPYQNLFEFCKRLDLRKVNRRVIEALISAGAMDKIGPSRTALKEALNQAVLQAEQEERNLACGQVDLFGGNLAESVVENVAVYPQVKEDKLQVLLQEKAVLGLFFSGHPLKIYEQELEKMRIVSLHKVRPTKRGETVRIAGMIGQSRRLKTKKGDIMQIISLDDGSGRLEVTLFPDQLNEFAHVLKSEAPIICEVEVQNDDFSGGYRGRATSLSTLKEAQASECVKLKVTLDHHLNENDKLARLNWLAQWMQAEEGQCKLELCIRNTHGQIHLTLPDQNRIKLTQDSLTQLHAIFDEQALEFYY